MCCTVIARRTLQPLEICFHHGIVARFTTLELFCSDSHIQRALSQRCCSSPNFHETVCTLHSWACLRVSLRCVVAQWVSAGLGQSSQTKVFVHFRKAVDCLPFLVWSSCAALISGMNGCAVLNYRFLIVCVSEARSKFYVSLQRSMFGLFCLCVFFRDIGRVESVRFWDPCLSPLGRGLANDLHSRATPPCGECDWRACQWSSNGRWNSCSDATASGEWVRSAGMSREVFAFFSSLMRTATWTWVIDGLPIKQLPHRKGASCATVGYRQIWISCTSIFFRTCIFWSCFRQLCVRHKHLCNRSPQHGTRGRMQIVWAKVVDTDRAHIAKFKSALSYFFVVAAGSDRDARSGNAGRVLWSGSRHTAHILERRM